MPGTDLAHRDRAIKQEEQNPCSHAAYNLGAEKEEKDKKYHQKDHFSECTVS